MVLNAQNKRLIRERGGSREGGRERERESDRESERQREGEKDRKRERERECKTESESESPSQSEPELDRNGKGELSHLSSCVFVGLALCCVEFSAKFPGLAPWVRVHSSP